MFKGLRNKKSKRIKGVRRLTIVQSFYLSRPLSLICYMREEVGKVLGCVAIQAEKVRASVLIWREFDWEKVGGGSSNSRVTK